MSYRSFCGKIVLLIILTNINETFSSNLVYELRKKYLSGDYSVKDVLETQEFDFPENVLAKLTLFEIYSDQENFQKMGEIYQNIYGYFPINQLLEYKLGNYYYNKKEYEKSKEYFLNCVKRDSRFLEARNFLAKSYCLTNEYKEAYRHYNVISWFDTKNKELQKELCRLSSYIDNNQPIYNKNFTKNFVRISSYSDVHNSSLENSPNIDIGISTKDNGNVLNIDTIKLKCSDTFYILNDKNNIVLTCENFSEKEQSINTSWKIVYRKKLNSIAIISPILHKEYRIKSSYIILKSSNPNATFLIEEYSTFKYKIPIFLEYNGDIVLKTYKNILIAINRTKLDYYLYGVVVKEIGKDKPLEALKTQSVVARTLAIYRKNRKIHKQYDVCSGQHCQVYDGIRFEDKTVIEAVNSTLGEIIVYKSSSPIHAFFHSNCGGYTQLSQSIGWGSINYLQNISDLIDNNYYDINNNLYKWFLFPPKLYCSESQYVHSGKSRWLRIIEKSELSKTLNKYINIGELKNIQILSRSSSGYVTKIKLVGKNKDVIINKESVIRRIFFPGGLRSTAFLLEYNKNNNSYYFWGAGWGHGVGMCQDGACGLAERGENYINIIRHYYPGTEVLKIY